MNDEIKNNESDSQTDSETSWGLYIIVIGSIVILIGIVIQAYIQNH